MKIVTWNLCASEFLVDDTSTVPAHQLPDALDREARCLRMLAALQQHVDADVLLLQEVMPDECKRICAMFPHHTATVGHSIPWYASTQWESSNVTLIRNPHAECVFDPKLFTDVDGGIINASTDDSYAVANLHLDDCDPDRRRGQLQSILIMTAKYKTCIIGGDFNEQCCASSDSALALSAFGFKTLCNPAEITYTGTDGDASIDQIAVKGYARAFSAESRFQNVVKFTSDHALVSATSIPDK